MSSEIPRDGVHALVPRDRMTAGARKLRDTYAITPGASLYQREFGFFSLERWKQQGMPPDADLAELFGFDPPGKLNLGQLGWCEAAFTPPFENEVLEDRGDYEVIQDEAGRRVLVFKGRRSGFMPEYLDHPVKDRATWEQQVKWRLDPEDPARYRDLDERMAEARGAAAEGRIITQNLIGGYMYLRSLMGPEGLLYMLYDDPDLIRDCMRSWLDLADAVIRWHQQHVTLDEVFIAEDICYNAGPLIGPEMMREMLLPYYRQLLANVRSRQIDPDRALYFQVDTDGFVDPVIPVYREIGMTTMSPFEVASGCDVVRTGRQYPDLSLFGGIDKRILAKSKAEIDRELERILPAMRERGGYIPTCDHGVPPEVPYENYLHYRKRCLELGN